MTALLVDDIVGKLKLILGSIHSCESVARFFLTVFTAELIFHSQTRQTEVVLESN